MGKLPKDANRNLTKDERHKLFTEAKAGNSEHKQYNSLAKNLIPINSRPEEEQLAIRRKGWEKMMQIKGDKKSAKRILDDFLPIYATNLALNENSAITDDLKALIKKHNIKITQYDLIMLAMISKAQQGDVKASAYISDLYGDIRTKEIRNVNDVMSQADKELINNIADRLGISTDILDADIREIEEE